MVGLVNIFQQRIAYLLKLLVTTPHWGGICCLQLVSGLLSFFGLPLLIPVLEMMQKADVSSQAGGYARFILPFFNYLGLKPDFHSMLVAAGVLIIAGQLLVNASSLIASFVKEELLSKYRKRIFEAYSLVDWQWMTDNHSARMYHAVVREAEQACEAHMNAQRVFINLFQIGVFFLISLRLSWQITLLAASVYGILAVLNYLNLNIINRLSETINDQFKQFSNDTVSFQHNKKFIKVSLLGQRFLSFFNKVIDQMKRLRKRQMLHVELQRSWSMMSTSVLLIVLIFFHQALSLNYATLLMILFIFLRLAPQFVALSDIYSTLDMNVPMHRSLIEHLDSLERNKEKNGAIDYQYPASVRFDHVRFGYPGHPPVLNDLSMVIEPNEMVSIVGKSGAGKSTILDIMLGMLRPQSGVVHYGDIRHDELNKESFRRYVAFVGQRPSLLDGTLRENLSIGRSDVTDEEIARVCTAVHLSGFIAQLPQGLHTVVGENGVKLSGGQRQRLVLARCLLMQPKILILDEATSELDTESELAIQQALKALRSTMTIIIVAHRLSTVKASDRIYMIEEGVACESGTYDQLLAQKGRFHDLVSSQH